MVAVRDMRVLGGTEEGSEGKSKEETGDPLHMRTTNGNSRDKMDLYYLAVIVVCNPLLI